MTVRQIKMRLKGVALYAPYAMTDRRRNRACGGVDRRFLILRHSAKNPHFHDYFLNWMAEKIPSVRTLFEQRLLPCYRIDWSQYSVCAPWLQDPAEDWLPRGSWKRLQKIQQQCERQGIPVINPSQHLANATKSAGARIMAELGVRVPRAVPIQDSRLFCPHKQGLRFPLIIREDRKHSAPTCLVQHERELRQVPWGRFACPVAAEFIDVQDPKDGLYRKYRYLAAGNYGVPRHLIVSRHWEVRAGQREHNSQTQHEEMCYLQQQDVNHETFQRVRQALELDLVALDYSYTRDGKLVVWEANPYPNLSYPTGRDTEYTKPYVERSFAAIAAMYLAAGDRELDPQILGLLGCCMPRQTQGGTEGTTPTTQGSAA